MQTVYMVITDSGDGSNGTQWVLDPKVVDFMSHLADEGEESYASGDGLQVTSLKFPDNFDVNEFAKTNHITWYTLEEIVENYKEF